MAFSVFANAVVTRRANRHARLASSFMVRSMVMLAGPRADHYVACSPVTWWADVMVLAFR